MINMLKELAGEGPALELGIGTGRIALPLQEKGVLVHGIDSSKAMLAKLNAKPGGDGIPVTMGSFAGIAAIETYSLVYVVFNTFFALLTQRDQVACFRNVARSLAPGGAFLIEAFVPDLARFSGGQTIRTNALSETEVRFDVSTHDSLNQHVMSQHVVMTEKGVRFYPVKLRYAWPSELDLMAELAGLKLKDRWGGWSKEAFTTSSTMHVSIYEPGV
jgi:SAM-dependent methyltransferase